MYVGSFCPLLDRNPKIYHVFANSIFLGIELDIGKESLTDSPSSVHVPSYLFLGSP
jgi:hypothetical protein